MDQTRNIIPNVLSKMSWNSTGVMTGIPYLCDLLGKETFKICGLSEHWLLPHNVNILSSIDKNYSSLAKTCRNPHVLNGRLMGKGGVALLWHKSLNKVIEPVDIDSDRIIAIRVR